MPPPPETSNPSSVPSASRRPQAARRPAAARLCSRRTPTHPQADTACLSAEVLHRRSPPAQSRRCAEGAAGALRLAAPSACSCGYCGCGGARMLSKRHKFHPPPFRVPRFHFTALALFCHPPNGFAGPQFTAHGRTADARSSTAPARSRENLQQRDGDQLPPSHT
jgi:hypothetical protein